MKWLFPVFVVAGAGLYSGDALAQSSDPAWLDNLRLQLRIEKECEPRFFLNIRESKSAAGTTYSARVQCEDGRRFDAKRTEPELEFTIDECGQAVCEADTDEKDKT